MKGTARIYSGLVDYRQALGKQGCAVELCRSSGIPTLFVMQHPPTVTSGINTEEKDHKLSDAELEQRGIAVVRVERGGRDTYHGPGQLVAYPILEIPSDFGKGRHVRNLEDAAVAFFADYGVETVRSPDRKHPGVYVAGSNKKLAAVGVEFRQGGGHPKYVSLHGVAINVNTGPNDFNVIYPCGDTNASITSLAMIHGAPVDMNEAMRRFVEQFSRTTGIGFTLEEIVHEPSSA